MGQEPARSSGASSPAASCDAGLGYEVGAPPLLAAAASQHPQQRRGLLSRPYPSSDSATSSMDSSGVERSSSIAELENGDRQQSSTSPAGVVASTRRKQLQKNNVWFSSETAEVQPQADDVQSLPWGGGGGAAATTNSNDNGGAADTPTSRDDDDDDDAARFAAESSSSYYSILVDVAVPPPPSPAVNDSVVSRPRNDTLSRLPQLRAPWNLDRIDQEFLPLDTGCATAPLRKCPIEAANYDFALHRRCGPLFSFSYYGSRPFLLR